MLKRFVFILSLMFCSIAFAQTIRWHVGDSVYTTTTCSTGDSITPPTAPAKTGYNFVKWKLPYTEIEYLESTGTQYIDTGIPGKDIGNIYIEFSIFSNDRSIMGVYNNTRLQCFVDGDGILAFRTFVSSSTQDMIIRIYNDTKVSIYWDIKNATVNTNNTLYNLSKGSHENINYTMYLFGANDRGNLATPSTMLLYNCKIYDNSNVLVRDFIPVLDENGTPCMYDKVTRKFFYNQGTGVFIAGPIIQ